MRSLERKRSYDKFLIFVRHGATQYTGTYPDLTEKGEKDAHSAARHIESALLEYQNCQLILHSSPQARALGTADILKNDLKEKFSVPFHVSVLSELDAVQIRDPERAQAVYTTLGSGGYIDYEGADQFEDPTMFEPRSEVRARFFRFLIGRIRQISRENTIEVFVGHYELFCNLVAEICHIEATESTSLQHCEPIFVLVKCTDAPTAYSIECHFRGKIYVRTLAVTEVAKFQ